MPANGIYKLIKKSMRIRRTIHNTVSFLEGLILSGYKDAEVLRMIQQTNKECEMWVTTAEAMAIYSIVKTQQQKPGVMAEVGVYQGGSARLICEAKGEKHLHLFDTFTGIPETSEKDDGFFVENMFQANVGLVEKYLSKYENVTIHPGIFPETGAAIKDETFSFVFLDVDTYRSTKASLEFFNSRMGKGGIILSHDYQYPGVKEAFREVGLDRQAMEIVDSLVMLVKV
jgi:predicted O-methyltransferase YrrM